MNDKKIFPQDDKFIESLVELLDLELVPDSLEDAENAVRNSNIDVDVLKKRASAVLREILTEFPDDWRNVATDNVESISTELEKMPLKLHLSEMEIKERIQNLISRITNANVHVKLPVPGLAWRNLENQSKEDLARLLRKFELIADEMGIEVKEE